MARSSNRQYNDSTGGNGGAGVSLPLLMAVAFVSFFGGTLFTMHAGIDGCISDSGTGDMSHSLNAKVEELAQKRLLELQRSLPKCQGGDRVNDESDSSSSSCEPFAFPDSVSRYAVGMARTSKLDFFEEMDIGVPMDLPKEKDSDVLILYSHVKTLPYGFSKAVKEHPNSIPPVNMKRAVENCEYVNVILTAHDNRNQCVAIVPQYESHHVQKWMRIGPKGIDKKEDLKLVSRGQQSNGRNQFEPPSKVDMKKNWDMLRSYFDAFDDVMKELKPLAEKVATKRGTVTVMVCNFGQSELLVNFVCSARSRKMDISSILVFATDIETLDLATSLGLTAFYDERNFGDMPSEAAGHYGDRKFTMMMMAKVLCVQMVSSLKYNILFQDVDIVWYKNPVPFFEENDRHLQEFDMLFQDDGGHTTRYEPYSANSGFYYVRHNERTEHFFNALLLAGDLILKTDSHQQALIALMNEHVSLYGLRVKVFSRDEDDFPGGYHFHQVSGKYMKKFFKGEVHPYIFHMSWTKNKDNKLKFLQQIGEWYVNEQCVHKKTSEIEGFDEEVEDSLASTCCSAEPITRCHYKDKPSIIPCPDSPEIDGKGKSFW